MEHSWILIVAMIGHILCVYADRLLLCTPGGQFSFPDMKDNAKMEKLFGAKPESDPLRSIILGTLAMFMQFFGYLALGKREKQTGSCQMKKEVTYESRL